MKYKVIRTYTEKGKVDSAKIKALYQKINAFLIDLTFKLKIAEMDPTLKTALQENLDSKQGHIHRAFGSFQDLKNHCLVELIEPLSGFNATLDEIAKSKFLRKSRRKEFTLLRAIKKKTLLRLEESDKLMRKIFEYLRSSLFELKEIKRRFF